jgi:hypothetical protein
MIVKTVIYALRRVLVLLFNLFLKRKGQDQTALHVADVLKPVLRRL